MGGQNLQGAATANTWQQVLGHVETQLSRQSFHTWFEPTRFLSEDADSVNVRVPNSWFAEWLESNFGHLIQEALRRAQRPGLQVLFLPEGAGNESAPEPPREITVSQTASRPVPQPRLNPRYTFDSFVVSSCNQFAHAAAMAVAEQRPSSYNPLFIYGDVGLGKTHLMQAIGNQLARRGSVKMHYVSSEQFMNELINAIRFDKTHTFKNKYRNVELLLIDDIQFLADKERTQEEFFHTFNTLYESQRQIVLTSDCPPREITTLEERLRSRFEWGLIADIQPPDLETKVAILRKKAGSEGVILPDDVALFIASHTKSSIRELEGALIRVIAYASVQQRELDLDLARSSLKDLLESEGPAVTVEGIQKMVSNYYNLKMSQLKSKNNSKQIAFPRQIAMYITKQLTTSSLPEIGRRFGGKHHSTVIHAVNKIEKKRRTEKEFDRLINSFMESLQ